MERNKTLLLMLWNGALTAALIWLLVRPASNPVPAHEGSKEGGSIVPMVVRDTGALSDARIAHFMMDSVQRRFEMVKEHGDRFRSEGQRLEGDLQRELRRAEGRYQELMGKDHTYSTQAEVKADEAELQGLMRKIQEMQEKSEERMARMEADMLEEISQEIVGFLKEFNAQTGYDYIFSVQGGGQIWVGNPSLDITDAVIKGLNERYRARKKQEHDDGTAR